jgi:hypothetical protein
MQTILGGGIAGKRLTFENDPTREGELVVIGLGGRKCRHGCQAGRPRVRCPCTTNKSVRDDLELFGGALCEMVVTHRLSGLGENPSGRGLPKGVEV